VTERDAHPGPVPPASAIADVLALWGRDGWLSPPLATIVPAVRAVAGTARVLTLGHGPSGAGLGPLYDVLDGDLAGQAVVLAGADATPGAVWGEILATTAAGSAATAVLVDGAVRDVDALPPTPLYARGVNVVGPNGRAHVVAVDESASIGAVSIDSGDTVVADASGCVRITSGDRDAVLEAAGLYAQAEDRVLKAVHSGTPLAEAYLIKKTAVDQLRKG
jgi:regulator of RNase E activity RraA